MQDHDCDLTLDERFAAVLRYATHSDNPTVISTMEKLIMVCRLADAPGLERELDHERRIKHEVASASLPTQQVVTGYVIRTLKSGDADEIVSLENYLHFARRRAARTLREQALDDEAPTRAA